MNNFKLLPLNTLICLVFLTSPAFSDITPEITIGTAVQHALDRNPDLLRAREAMSQAGYDYNTAITKLFPTIAAQAQGSYQKDSSLLNYPNFGGEAYNDYQVLFTLSQPIYDGGATLAGLHYANKTREIQRYNAEITERALTESVIEQFYSVLLNERLTEILQNTYNVDKETLGVAQRYYRIGRAQRLDVLQLQTQAAQLVPQIAQAQNQIQTSASQLATLLRNLDAPQIHLKGKLVSPNPKWVHLMLEKKLSELPEVLQSRAMVDQSQDNRSIQMAQYWPKLSILGQLGRIAYAKTDLLEDAATSWAIGLQLNVPIFSGLSSISQRRSLESQEKQLEYDETKTSDTVSVNQIQTEKDLSVAETALETSKDAAKWGKESLTEAEKQYRLNTINYLQYQTSLQAYLISQTGYYQAKYNYIVAVAKYFMAVGVPLSNLVSELENLSHRSSEVE